MGKKEIQQFTIKIQKEKLLNVIVDKPIEGANTRLEDITRI